MNAYSRSHLADHSLLRQLDTHLSQDRSNTAALLADLGEVDERQLYRPAACDSMYEYCTRELHMSEETAFRRIRVARTARRFPVIFPALADGRLHLTAVLLLTPHLSPETADELLAAATHKTKAEIELLLAERYPRPDVPTLMRAIFVPIPNEAPAARSNESADPQLAPEPVAPSIPPTAPLQMEPPLQRTRLSPLSAERYEWRLTVDKETQERLRYAQALLGHAVPSGDVPQVLKRALDALVRQLEKQKFANTSRSRPQRGPAMGRHVPSEVKRTVWQRDGGQCTFVSEQGKRCEARARLEFDHIQPFARGGPATVGGIRLRCRAHNQLAAEHTYGAEFMRGKRAGHRGRSAQAPTPPERATRVASQRREGRALPTCDRGVGVT
jgi:hypothetical protein